MLEVHNRGFPHQRPSRSPLGPDDRRSLCKSDVKLFGAGSLAPAYEETYFAANTSPAISASSCIAAMVCE